MIALAARELSNLVKNIEIVFMIKHFNFRVICKKRVLKIQTTNLQAGGEKELNTEPGS